MSLLSQVTKGKIRKPEFILIYGPDGVGKSTFAADAPNSIFLGTEDGTANLSVSRFPAPKRLEDVLQAVRELQEAEHGFKTLAIDSLDWIEPLVWEKVCRDGGKDHIEDFGYGKGYVNALKEWRALLDALRGLREIRKMNVILIAHSQVKTFNDPQLIEPYDRYQLKLNDKASALFREAVEAVLFANYETLVKSKKNDMEKTKAFGDGRRVIFTERRPAFDAKNRQGLPFEIPLSWEDYRRASQISEPEDPETLKRQITGLLENVTSKPLIEGVTKSLAEAGSDAVQLSKILNRLKTRIAA